MKLKYPFNLMSVGAMLQFPANKAQAVRQAMHNYGQRNSMFFRSKRKCKGGDIIIYRIA